MLLLTIILIVIGTLTLYIRLRIYSKLAIDKLLTLSTIIILLHSIHSHIIFTHFSCCPYLEAFAPYRLLFAPLIYFSIQLAQIPAKKVSKKQLIIHLLPFIAFTVLYLSFSFSAEFRIRYGGFGLTSLLLAEILSYLSYAIASVILIYKSIGKSKWYPHMKILAEIAVMLTILAGTYSLIKFFKESEQYTYSLNRSYDFIPFLLLMTIILLFMLSVEQLINRIKPIKTIDLFTKKNESILLNNKKVQLSEHKESKNISDKENLEVTELLNKLEDLKATNWFLNPEINLNSLAKKTNNSKYFLSNVINETLQVNFNQYLNQLRIEYLVRNIKERIKEGESIESIEELYHKAGFKSKSTFNRHFKRNMSQTPTQFIDSLNNDF